MKKRILSLLIVLSLCLAALGAPVLAAAYSDVPASGELRTAVDFVTSRGLMDGTGSGKFSPDGTLSRAMLAAVLWRLEGKPAVDYAMTCPDVAEGAWYTEAVRWAASEGLVRGYPDGTLGPERTLTREQSAVILYRYAAKKGYDTSAAMGTAGYEDIMTVSSYARDAVTWAGGAGILKGFGSKLLPCAAETRGAEAQSIAWFCGLFVK